MSDEIPDQDVAPPPTRRDELVDSLTEIFLRQGFAALSMDAIASLLSCSKATLYVMAPSRSLLIKSIASKYFRDAAATAEAAAARHDSPDGAVSAYLSRIAVDLGRASPRFIEDLELNASTRGLYELNTRLAARRVGELASQGDTAADTYLEELVTAVMLHLHRGGFRTRGVDDAEVVGRLARLLSTGTLLR